MNKKKQINEKIQKSKDVQVKIEKSSLRIVTRDSTGTYLYKLALCQFSKLA